MAIVAHVADTVGELGLQADVTRGVQLDTSSFLLLRPLPDRVLQDGHLVLFAPERNASISFMIMYRVCARS